MRLCRRANSLPGKVKGCHENSMSDPRFQTRPPFTDQDIHRIEELLGRKLPDDYCKFVREYGGARVHGIVDGSEDFPIDSFNEAAQFNISAPNLPEWEEYREIGALPFASCLLGNIWVLTIENEVFYIDYYTGETKIHKVADSFGDFISRISLRQYDGQI